MRRRLATAGADSQQYGHDETGHCLSTRSRPPGPQEPGQAARFGRAYGPVRPADAARTAVMPEPPAPHQHPAAANSIPVPNDQPSPDLRPGPLPLRRSPQPACLAGGVGARQAAWPPLSGSPATGPTRSSGHCRTTRRSADRAGTRRGRPRQPRTTAPRIGPAICGSTGGDEPVRPNRRQRSGSP